MIKSSIIKLPPTVINVSKDVSKALLILAVNVVRTNIPPSIIKVLDNNKFESRLFNLGGHQKYSFYQILKLLKQTKKIKCLLIKLPKYLELPLVSILELSPFKIITRDNLKSLKVDNICDVNHAYEFLTNLKDLKTYIREL